MSPFQLRCCIVFGATALCLSGCLRPARNSDPIHTYVLSPLAVAAEREPIVREGASGGEHGQGFGIGLVEIPAYLLGNRMVFRKGNSEIRYSETHRWAERLDKGIQRVLGANLSLLLPTDRVELSSWQRQAVQRELYVSVHRFESDDEGEVVLEARWRIAAPGGNPTLLSRHSHIVRQASAGSRNVEAAVTELSQALAELSREIAAALTNRFASSAR